MGKTQESGAGHNANMNHAGDNNAYDETEKYHEYGERKIPEGLSVMSGDYNKKGQNIQSFITSPINQQPADKNKGTISIKAMYINRFGNEDAKAKLPVSE